MTLIARLRTIPSWQITLGAALLGLGFLIAAQLSSEGPRVRYTTQERTPLVETATELQHRQGQSKQADCFLVCEGAGRVGGGPSGVADGLVTQGGRVASRRILALRRLGEVERQLGQA